MMKDVGVVAQYYSKSLRAVYDEGCGSEQLSIIANRYELYMMKDVGRSSSVL